MKLAILLCLLPLVSCGAPEVGRDPITVARPSPATPARTAPADRRAQLEARCLATPWSAPAAKDGPRPLSDATAERLEILERECRDIHPELGPGRFGGAPPYPVDECHYGIARIYFDVGHYPEAARWFGRVAFGEARPDSDVGPFAAQLYVESLRRIWSGATPPRPECERLIYEDAHRLYERHCSGADVNACAILRSAGSNAQPCSAGLCGP